MKIPRRPVSARSLKPMWRRRRIEVDMARTTRRQFVQQTALAAAAIYGSPINLLGAGRKIFGEREQNAAPLDAAAIRKLTSQISGHLITPEAPNCAPSEKAAALQWVKSLRDNLQPFAQGVYVNQLGETSATLVRAAYGPNYARLAEIKKKYDPRTCCG